MAEREQRVQREESGAARVVPVLQGYLPLGQLKNVSVKTPDSFLKDLGKLDAMVRDLPIALPKDGEYLIELHGEQLHVYECTFGIEGYQLFGAGSVLRRDKHTDINVETDRGLCHVVLYHEPREDFGSWVRRKSSPYRDTQWSGGSSSGSESRGYLGGGER